MASINIPVVSEREYEKFRSIGVLSQFTEDYSSFLDLMDKRKKEIGRGGIILREVNIDFAGFKEWFDKVTHGKRPFATYNDLFQYAATVNDK